MFGLCLAGYRNTGIFARSLHFIHTIEKRQGLKIACLEEISFDKEYITIEQLRELATPFSKNECGEYLM